MHAHTLARTHTHAMMGWEGGGGTRTQERTYVCARSDDDSFYTRALPDSFYTIYPM